VLAHTGLNTTGIADRLYLKDGSSDKTGRRKVAEEQFRVLLHFGDNLRDFSEEFKVKPGQTTMASRAAQVDAAADKWGKNWIILPNPSYGEWERLLHSNPADDLRPTKMAMPSP
jgi:acid phosphatase